MGFFNFLTGGVTLANSVAAPSLGSPWAGDNSLEAAIVGDFFGEVPSEVITPEIALRVPEVNRALQAHQALVSPLKFELYRDGARAAEQPLWVTSSDSGISPFIRQQGVVRDLFLHGWALLGAELDDATDLPRDLIHIPFSFWSTDNTGSITVDESIPAKYRQRLILVPLGSNGLLVDGIDSIRQARKLELARQARLDAPPPGIDIHLDSPDYDGLDRAEMEKIAADYAAIRRKTSVSVTKSFMTVTSQGSDVDLFETGMNSLRLQLGMHAGVPASFLEAGKEGGSTGQMTYTNENGKASELWVFGSSRFAYALTARLSMDDVVGPNAEVRADLSDFMVPTPDQLSAESPVSAPTE